MVHTKFLWQFNSDPRPQRKAGRQARMNEWINVRPQECKYIPTPLKSSSSSCQIWLKDRVPHAYDLPVCNERDRSILALY